MAERGVRVGVGPYLREHGVGPERNAPKDIIEDFNLGGRGHRTSPQKARPVWAAAGKVKDLMD